MLFFIEFYQWEWLCNTFYFRFSEKWIGVNGFETFFSFENRNVSAALVKFLTHNDTIRTIFADILLTVDETEIWNDWLFRITKTYLFLFSPNWKYNYWIKQHCFIWVWCSSHKHHLFPWFTNHRPIYIFAFSHFTFLLFSFTFLLFFGGLYLTVSQSRLNCLLLARRANIYSHSNVSFTWFECHWVRMSKIPYCPIHAVSS